MLVIDLLAELEVASVEFAGGVLGTVPDDRTTVERMPSSGSQDSAFTS